MYSIVDIETTGARSKENKITEIAIINFDGEKITETFSTLINPETSIPPFIQKLTGISNDMVASGPKFYEIAKKIVQFTEGNIFVAHNVHFDYNFIQQEFRELGFQFKRDKLCSLRLARKALPGHKSYSLGKLCDDLQIKNNARHRALGDAQATLELFKLILAKDSGDVPCLQMEVNNKMNFPPYLNPKDYEALPHTPGIYYLWDKEHKLLYIGKSKDIKKRVAQHFKVTTQRTKEIIFKNNIAGITFKETGNDLAAQLIECQEIKNHRPLFNRSMNKKRYPYSIHMLKDPEGRMTLNVTKLQMDDTISVGSKHSAENLIQNIFKKAFALGEEQLYQTQLKLLQKTLPTEVYNQALQKEFKKLHYPHHNFEVITQGRNSNEKCIIQINDNKMSRLIYKSEEKEDIFMIDENRDSRRILLSCLQKKKFQIHDLD